MSPVAYANLPAAATTETPGRGLSTITIPAATCSNTTLDLAVAAVSGRTGDVALNYDRVVITAGTIATGNCTLTLGDGHYLGQIFEIVLTGAMVTSDVVVSITKCVDDAKDEITMDSGEECLIVRWNGYAWNVLSADVGA